MKRIILGCLALLATAGGANAQAPLLPYGVLARPSVAAVTRFAGADKDHLVYELLLQNFEKRPIRIDSLQIEVRKAGKNVFVKELREAELTKSFSLTAENQRLEQVPILPFGRSGILYLFLDLPPSVGPADAIVNRLTLSDPAIPGSSQTQAAVTLSVSPGAARVLAPPLKGQYWWTFNAPSNNSIHRRVVVPLEGNVWFPERLASDWILLNEQGKNFTGPTNQNASYHAYGKELYAVANAKVVQVKDGIPENVPTAPDMAVPITLETIAGNHVILDLGGGLYALYAHIQPGSLKVKAGDRVKTGQLIGLLGNSGNSTEPHLHFHVIDRPDPLMGQGQPYVFDRFVRMRGEVKMNEKEELLGMSVSGGDEVRNQAYMNYEIVAFE